MNDSPNAGPIWKRSGMAILLGLVSSGIAAAADDAAAGAGLNLLLNPTFEFHAIAPHREAGCKTKF